jgi:2-succinyl-5-enolpyruvyl-6-hydroxy-3-cyclohexene-1-carboxylate synthase
LLQCWARCAHFPDQELPVSDPQSHWAALLLATLAEAGVQDAIISPGSRSTPLVWAACQVPALRRHAIIDERGAGFFALGQARVSGRPSLLICTSGSAPSHYFPAVIEARHSGVPLIVLSADRPFELQQCGAQQTIDQVRLFGNYAAYHEIGTAVVDRAATLGVQRVAWQAVASALEPPRGPVHLNFRAKKPLEPPLGERPSSATPERGQAPRSVRWSPAPPGPVAAGDVMDLVQGLTRSRCPLLICGALSIQESPSPDLVLRFAAASGAIVCAESVSQLRFQLDPEQPDALVCDGYDWLLANAQLSKRAAPDFALQIGAAPLSANLGRLLEDSETLEYAVCAETGWPDPWRKSARVVRARPSELLLELCRALEARPRAEPTPEQRLWRAASARVRALLTARLEQSFGEPEAVRVLCDALPAESILAVGNSLPPRLIDRYARAGARQIRVVSQRGASGIDGVLAGALGAASRADAPTTLLCGDISFLHDVSSLWAARSEHTHGPAWRHPVVLVVINNGGGRIFEQLPLAKQPGIDQSLWTTPHGLQLEGAAKLYGLEYWLAGERGELRAALAAAYARCDVSLIEVAVEPHSAGERLPQVGAELERQLAELLAEP